MKPFKITHIDSSSKARCGILHTPHGDLLSPFFMPVGTNATVKAIPFEELINMGAQIVLGNTYHLFLRPGLEIIQEAGGLHPFMRWERPILTDSGGYQVFSLAQFRKITDKGVEFQSHLDGGVKHFFTPEKIIAAQAQLGSDIMMPLDECSPYPCEKAVAQKAVERTNQWAKRAREFFISNGLWEKGHLLFGIVQGSIYKNLREQSANDITGIGFDGYAIGGVSVGEPVPLIFEAINHCVPHLPEEKARYLMGIGMPDQIVHAVGEGIDMFDTCIPTRYGRYGTVFTHDGPVVIRNGEYKKDQRPLDEQCDCFVCRKYTRSYIRHLLNAHEILGLYMTSYHNVYFYLRLMQQIRLAIQENRYAQFQKEFLACYQAVNPIDRGENIC